MPAESRTADILEPGDVLLTPAEVATLFNVNPKTVTRWAAKKKLRPVLTPGGHRRYRKSEVLAFFNGAAGSQDDIGDDYVREC